jgi:hypothetical protein
MSHGRNMDGLYREVGVMAGKALWPAVWRPRYSRSRHFGRRMTTTLLGCGADATVLTSEVW